MADKQKFSKKSIGELTQEEVGLVYDPYLSPPNFHQALAHQNATLFGEVVDKSLIDPQTNLPANTKKLSLNSSLLSLAKIDVGHALYFETVKFIIILFGVLSAVSILTILKYHKGTYCPHTESDGNPYCADTLTVKLSFINYLNNFKDDHIHDCLLYVLIIIIGCQIWRVRFHSLSNRYQSTHKLIEKYTIMVGNLPQKFSEDVDMKKVLTNYFESMNCAELKRNYSVKQIVLVYNLQDYFKLKHQESEICLTGKNDDRLRDIRAQIEEMRSNILASKCNYFTGKAYVTFDTVAERNKLLRANGHYKDLDIYLIESEKKKTIFKFEMKDTDVRYLYFTKAIPPEDVRWSAYKENIKSVSSNRIKGIAMCVGILVGSILINLGYKILTTEIKKIKNVSLVLLILEKIVYYIIFAFMLLLNIKVIPLIAKIMDTRSNYQDASRQAYKITQYTLISVIVNSGVIPFLLSFFMSDKYQSFETLVDCFTKLIIISLIISPVMTVIALPFRGKIKKQSKLAKNKENCKLNQEQLNKIFEYPKFGMTNKFAAKIKGLWNAALLSPWVPIAIPLIFIGTIVQYYAEKSYLLTKCGRVERIGKSVSKRMISSIESTAVVFAISHTLFRKIYKIAYYSKDQKIEKFLIYALVVATVLYMYLPINKALKKILVRRKKDDHKMPTYTELFQGTDFHDYTTTNPILKNIQIKKDRKIVEAQKRMPDL